MISDLEWSMYHSSDYYCGVIHFVMSPASPDLHVRPLAAGGEIDDLVGEAFVAHVHTSGILMSGVAVPAHFLGTFRGFPFQGGFCESATMKVARLRLMRDRQCRDR